MAIYETGIVPAVIHILANGRFTASTTVIMEGPPFLVRPVGGSSKIPKKHIAQTSIPPMSFGGKTLASIRTKNWFKGT